MKKGTMIWLILAAGLVICGCIIFAVVMTMHGWNFSEISTTKFETNTHTVSEDFKSIAIKCDTADIDIFLSEDNKASVVCYEETTARHAVTVTDGTLSIELENNKKWYEHIGINFNTPKISVYLPEGDYGALSIKASTGNANIPESFKFESIDIAMSTGMVDCASSATGAVKIKTTTGDIRVFGISCASLDLLVSTGKITAEKVDCTGDVEISVSTGKAKLSDFECQSLTSTGNTGDISLEGVIAKEKISVERSTGDVTLSGSDDEEIYIKTDTGDARGTLLSDKVFITETDTGSVNVPKTTAGGKCEITTDTGNIKIEIE